MASSIEPRKLHFGPALRLGSKDDGLAYYVFNPEGSETVLFLHGGMTGASEWDIVIPHFSRQYHLLIPDLPFHDKSANVRPENAAIGTGNLLRDLVRSEAKQGQAHVVGLSMGAHIGWKLAVQCSEVVQTCFLSGINRVDWIPWKKYLPHVVFAVESVGSRIPKSWLDGISHSTDTTTPHDLEHFKQVWALILDDGDIIDKPWKARTLLVAATKGGLIPTNDPIKDARQLALVGQQENPETTAVQNQNMRHAWNRQEPRMFAEAVMCWIERKPLPNGFKPI